MIEQITSGEVLEEIRGKIGYGYSQSQMAQDVGVSGAYVTEVLAGRKAPSKKFLDYLGVEKVVTTSYVKKSQ